MVEELLNIKTPSTKLLPTSSTKLGSIITQEVITLENNQFIVIWVEFKAITIL